MALPVPNRVESAAARYVETVKAKVIAQARYDAMPIWPYPANILAFAKRKESIAACEQAWQDLRIQIDIAVREGTA